MDVAIDGVRHSRPGVVIYEGLKLSIRRRARASCDVRQLEAAWTSMTGSQGDSRPAIVLSRRKRRSRPRRGIGWRQIVQRRLQGQGGRPELEVRVAADEVTLRNG